MARPAPFSPRYQAKWTVRGRVRWALRSTMHGGLEPAARGEPLPCPRLARSPAGLRGAFGVPLPPAAAVPRRCMPSGPTPSDPIPFDGWRPAVTLSKDEVLDVTTTLEEVIGELADRDLLDLAEELARVREHLLSRLER